MVTLHIYHLDGMSIMANFNICQMTIGHYFLRIVKIFQMLGTILSDKEITPIKYMKMVNSCLISRVEKP